MQAQSAYMLLVLVVCSVHSMALNSGGGDEERFAPGLDKAPGEDGGVETALMNYLFAKQVVNRLRNQLEVTDLQRKRSYWKQCAFNAVSCFGK